MQNMRAMVAARWLAAIVVLMITAAAPAAIWDSESTTDDNWSTGLNWTGDIAPGAGDSAIFDATASGGTAGDFASVTGFSVVDASTTVQKLLVGGAGAGSSTTHTLTIGAGLTLDVGGDGDGSLNQADFTVGQDLSASYVGNNSVNVTISGVGSTLRVGAAATHTADVVISRRTAADGNVTTTLNMSGLSNFEANVDEFAVGYAGTTSAAANFTVQLADNNTINANLINLGDSANAGVGNANTVKLGTTNVFNADNIYVGHKKTGMTLSFNTGLTNPTLTINDTAGTGAANLFVGVNEAGGTGTVPTSTMDTTAGTFNATLNQVVIGRHGSGSGSGSGTLSMGDGTVTANSVLLADSDFSGVSTNDANTKGTLQLTAATSAFNVAGSVTDGGGASTLQVDQGDMTIGGDLVVDTLRVGLNGGAGDTTSLTVSGTNVAIGSAGSETLLDIGRRSGNLGTGSGDIVNVLLDLSAATNFTANLTEFRVGTNDSVGSGQRRHESTILLAANSDITANKLTLAHTTSVGGAGNNKLRLGAVTVMNIDEIVIGGSKSGATLDFLAGGSTLTINGTAGAGNRADLYIGRQLGGTGGGSSGNVNGAGSTINAELDNLVIGTKPNDATGITQGTMTFAAGLIDVNTLTLGERQNAGSSGTVKGTFNFTGGTLKAATITPGSGNGSNVGDVAKFNWTGGTLHVDTFAMTLDQNGGILAPGNSPGMSIITGDYNQANLNSATYEVELNGFDQGDQTLADGFGYDFVDVAGNAVLDGILKAVLLDGFMPTFGSTFDVLTAASITLGANFTLDQSMASLSSGYFTAEIISGGNGQILQLQVVPLPTGGMMGLGLLGAVSLLRRRRGA